MTTYHIVILKHTDTDQSVSARWQGVLLAPAKSVASHVVALTHAAALIDKHERGDRTEAVS